MVSYSPSIVTMAVSVAVCDIFTKYITNGYRYGHSYYRRRIGNHTKALNLNGTTKYYLASKNGLTLKTGLGFVQGHWKWHQ